LIDDVEYKYEDMTEEQQMIVNHIADLDRKISAARFNVDQLSVGKDAFVDMLRRSLSSEDQIEAVN
jgi:cell division septum initiation protein DivIVA